jgi:hypothetical protein
MECVHTPVTIDAYVTHAAVGLHEVVVEHVQVVVVNVDGRRLPIRIGLRRTVCGDPDPVMKVGDGVVRNDVPGSVDFDSVVTCQQVGRVRANLAPSRSGPNQAEAVVPAKNRLSAM